MSVLRCYSQKKTGFDVEAQGLLGALRDQLGIRGLESVVILNRYDADQIDPAIYEQAKGIVFSEPQVDAVYDETFPVPEYPHRILAVEALPGQFDQRADSAAQCIQLMAGVDRPLIAYAKVYLLGGRLTEEELDKIRRYLINPVESREASMDKPATLVRTHEAPDHVAVIQGFTTLDEPGLAGLLSRRSVWWIPTGLTTAATPPFPPTSTGWRSWTPRWTPPTAATSPPERRCTDRRRPRPGPRP